MRNFTPRIAAALLTFTAGVALTTGLLANRYAVRQAAGKRAAVDLSPLEAAERVAHRRDSDPSYLLAEIAVRHAELGEFEQAARVVNTVEDESERVTGMAKIAAALWRSGAHAKAIEVFDSLRVLDVREGKTVLHYHSYTSGLISEQFAAAEQYDRALALAAAGGNDHLTRTALDAVVDNYRLETGETGESELLTRVVALAKSMQSGEGGRVIEKVALLYAKAGQYDRAVRMAESLRDPHEGNFDRDETLQLIALELARHGEYGRAAGLARKTDGFFKHPALAAIAVMLLEKGRKAEALGLLSEVRRSPYRTVADDAALGVGYAQAGDVRVALQILDGAFEAAKEFGKPVERDEAVRKVAEAYAASGFYEQALAATQVGGYGFNQARALAAVAVEMAKAGRVEEVRRAVGVIEGSGVSGFQKASALSDVAAVYLKAGKVEAAKEMLAKALTLNLAEEERDHRERTTAEIAVKFAEAGDFEKAFEATREIRKVFEQTFALADIGVLQGKLGVGLSVQSRSLLNEMADSHSHN